MLDTRLLAVAAAATLAVASTAQNCFFNAHPIHVVDAVGFEHPETFDAFGNPVALVPTEDVFLAFDPSTPSGVYYVHVTGDGPFEPEVVSLNDPMDRFVQVTNVAGVISLSLPYSNDPAGAVFGAGWNGVGQSLRLGPLRATEFSGCEFKIQFGDMWDLAYGPEWPFLLRFGINPMTGLCGVYSFHGMRIGDGTPSDVSGVVFADQNRNGVQDAGEAGVAGREVRLSAGSVQFTTSTDAAGRYVFADVGRNEWTLELIVPSGFVATNASSQTLAVCACAPVEAQPMGIDAEILPCNAKPLAYWRSWHGVCEAHAVGVLPTLPALGIVNMWGQYVAPGTKWHLRFYLQAANNWNMAYALSAQLVAMHANVVSGRVHVDCVLDDPCLGEMTVGQLMVAAVAAIQLDRYTPPCSGSVRHQQALLRNALWRANANSIWR